MEGAVAVACYGGPLRAVILGLKFGGGLQAASFLGRLLGERLRATDIVGKGAPPSVLVPVPLARKDFSTRGFNQAEEIAAAISGHTGVPVASHLLLKNEVTPPQATLDREARRENLKGCFLANGREAKRLGRKRVLLVDDVMTTGATAGECARVLREAGLDKVLGAMVARG
jgi:ComF family protein